MLSSMLQITRQVLAQGETLSLVLLHHYRKQGYHIVQLFDAFLQTISHQRQEINHDHHRDVKDIPMMIVINFLPLV